MVLSTEAREYKAAVFLRAIQARLKPIPAPTPCTLTIHWYRAQRSGDLDNRLKVIGDALIGTAYEDDKQIVELHAFRHDDKTNPRVEITIEGAA